MNSFPLYDILSNLVEQNGVQEIDKQKLIKTINNNLDQDGKNKVYALIKYFSLNYNQTTEKLPFEGYTEESTIFFDLDKLPIKLLHILSEFSKMHIQHMKDSQKIEKIRKKNNNK